MRWALVELCGLLAFERTDNFIREQGLRRINHQASWALCGWFPKGGVPVASPPALKAVCRHLGTREHSKTLAC
jgi:hypothetical protein